MWLLQEKWQILEAVILPTFFFNVENWTDIFKREIEKMEHFKKTNLSSV